MAMNLYFEIYKRTDNGSITFEYKATKVIDYTLRANLVQFVRLSQRVWIEDTEKGLVYYYKNRGGDPEKISVDMDEFLFVKLRSVYDYAIGK